MSIDIEELVLRVPGLAMDQAKSLGGEVARRVGEALSHREQVRKDVSELDLRLELAPGMALESLAQTIADAIVSRLC